MRNLQAHRRSSWVSSNVHFLYPHISQITPVGLSPRCLATTPTFTTFVGLLASISSSPLLSILPVINTCTRFNTRGLLLRTFGPRQRDFWNCHDAWNNNVFQHPKSIYPWLLQRNLCLNPTPPLVFPRCSAWPYCLIFYNSFPLQQEWSSLAPCLEPSGCKDKVFADLAVSWHLLSPSFLGHSSYWTASLNKRPGQWSHQKTQK